MILSIPQNVIPIAQDTRIKVQWDKVENADGYIITFYKEADCKHIFRTRYAERTSKTLLGFQNGVEYYIRVCAFRLKNGKEICSELSTAVSCIPFSPVLKLNRNVLIMKLDEAYQLNWEINNTKPKVDFSSSDNNVVSVDENGLVWAISDGKAVISARLAADEQQLAVTVVYVNRKASIDISDKENSLKPHFTEIDGCFVQAEKTATITMTGDIMCTINTQRNYCENDLYNFKPAFVQIKEMFSHTNLNIGVLETCVSHSYPYEIEERRNEKGAPNCNSPASLLSAIKNAGFDGLVTANNHCCDTGKDGLLETIEQIEKHGMINIGTFKVSTENRFSLFDINGIKVAVLAYFQLHNGITEDFTRENSMFMLNRYSSESLKRDVLSAKKNGAQFIIAYIHWGMMNSTAITDIQRKTAVEMADLGVDFIAGSHPHVVQQFDYIECENNKKVPCIYSMGNFFTGMEELKANRDSVAVQLKLTSDLQGTVKSEIKLIPCCTLNADKGQVIFRCDDIKDDKYNLLLKQSKERTEKILYSSKNKENALAEKIFTHKDNITVKQVLQLIGGTPNFDVTSISNKKISKTTYTNPRLKDSVYFVIRINDYTNPYDVDIELLKANPLFVVTQRELKGVNCLIVPNVNTAYQKFATEYKRLFSTKIVAITGSVGKTTTKNIITAVLEKQFKIQSTFDSKNIPNAVADNMLRLNSDSEYFVLETASSQPNQIHKSSLVGQPSACVITNIGTSHIDLMGSVQNICDTKMQILDGADKNAPIFLNADDSYLAKATTDHPVVYYGIDSENADYKAKNIVVGDNIITFDVVYKDNITPVTLQMHGKHNIYNALAAFAVGKWAGELDENIVAGLYGYKPTGIRQNVFDADGVTVIADCYSLDTISIISAVEALHEKKCEGRRICVLGHIMRMGKFTEEMHHKVGTEIAKNDIDITLCYDDDSHFVAEKVNELGKKALFFNNNKYKLIQYLRENVKKGDVVLFKGAQKYSHFEDIIQCVFTPTQPPEISALSAIAIDASSGEIKYGKNSKEKRSPVSLTMILTALVVLENAQLNEEVTVSQNSSRYSASGYSNMHLKVGDKLTVEDLLYGMIISSAFDAACTLAEFVGGTEQLFTEKMNKKAMEIGAVNSHFVDCCGIYNAEHFSTAEDLAKICACAMKNATFAKIVSATSYSLKPSKRKLYNKNMLLNENSPYFYQFATGLKCSNNKNSKYCIAASAEKTGRQAIAIILGSPDMPRGKEYDNNTPDKRYSYTDSMKLLEFVLNNWN